MTDLHVFTGLRDRASRTMAIFGAGLGGTLAFRALGREARIIAFVDNSANKWGTQVEGLPVISPAQLQAAWPDVVVVASQAIEPITEQLLKLGLGRDRIRVFHPSPDDVSHANFSEVIARVQEEISTLVGLPTEGGKPMRLVIFGAGAGGRDAFNRCRVRHRIIGFADNDPKKIGTEIFGLPVMAPATLKSTAFDRVVIGSMYFDQICGQLVSIGIPRASICSVDEVPRQGKGGAA
jgi:FlaA1/EpsC-like NDP-sugar epimerase